MCKEGSSLDFKVCDSGLCSCQSRQVKLQQAIREHSDLMQLLFWDGACQKNVDYFFLQLLVKNGLIISCLKAVSVFWLYSYE